MSDRIFIEVEGMQEVVQFISMLDDRTLVRVATAMSTIVLKIQKEVKSITPVLTGRLKASIKSKISKKGKGILGVVRTGVRYAPYVEFGSPTNIPRLMFTQTLSANEAFIIRKIEKALDQASEDIERKLPKKG